MKKECFKLSCGQAEFVAMRFAQVPEIQVAPVFEPFLLSKIWLGKLRV